MMLSIKKIRQTLSIAAATMLLMVTPLFTYDAMAFPAVIICNTMNLQSIIPGETIPNPAGTVETSAASKEETKDTSTESQEETKAASDIGSGKKYDYDSEEDLDSADTEDGYSTHTILNKNDPFYYIDIPTNKGTELSNILGSYYHMLMAFAVAGMVFSVMFAGVNFFRLAMGHRLNKEDILNTLGTKFIVFATLCCMASVVSFASMLYNMFR